jgi:hypothetical protein
MEIEALVCDAATVREGLLHLLGGGAGALWRESYPTTLGVDLGLLLTLHPSEATESHQLRILLQGEDGALVAQLDANFELSGPPPKVPPGQMVRVPLAVPLRQIVLPHQGNYSIEILVDKQHRRSLPLTAMPPGQQPSDPFSA